MSQFRTRLMTATIFGLGAMSLLAALPARAQEGDVIERWRAEPTAVFDAAEISLADLDYLARPLVIFAESPNQPEYLQQLALIAERSGDLVARDVIVIADTDPDARGEIRAQLRPRGFSLVLIDRDGTVVFRKPHPWDMREISRAIDKLPSRLQEIRDGAAALPD